MYKKTGKGESDRGREKKVFACIITPENSFQHPELVQYLGPRLGFASFSPPFSCFLSLSIFACQYPSLPNPPSSPHPTLFLYLLG